MKMLALRQVKSLLILLGIDPICCTTGSGGYDLPEERDAGAVRKDVIYGKISLRSTLEDYKVVLDKDLNIDRKATGSLRQSSPADV